MPANVRPMSWSLCRMAHSSQILGSIRARVGVHPAKSVLCILMPAIIPAMASIPEWNFRPIRRLEQQIGHNWFRPPHPATTIVILPEQELDMAILWLDQPILHRWIIII